MSSCTGNSLVFKNSGTLRNLVLDAEKRKQYLGTNATKIITCFC
ncbi:hypothetical protein T4B_7937 [Trichinella pseudospiralis]|uniref:Uncharacterized protein n=1 Tax=Trichinella pseudospiralis TaxID=6337 RepID=A0A0V1GLR0_TRIPS|nr:hypothetical protein T4B_7937 [Trichinella pseudospiralis]